MENKSPQQFLQFLTRPEVGVRDVQGLGDSSGAREDGREGCWDSHRLRARAAPTPLWSRQCQARCAPKKMHCNVFSASKVQGAEIIGKLEKNVDGDTATARDWCYYG